VDNLTRVAQYQSVIGQESGNDAKTEYLSFLKNYLIELESQKEGADDAYINQIKSGIDAKHFTELAFEELHCQNLCRTDIKNPLYNLTVLPFKIYITTSPHRFLEKMLALPKVNKQKHTSFAFQWSKSISIPEEYEPPEKIERPQRNTPLVYHLHGIDSYPQSLVLTEYDHLDFLLRFKQDFTIVSGVAGSRLMPTDVNKAITTNRLLLLDYEVESWELRTLLKGIEEYQIQKPQLSLAIQIDPGQQDTINGGTEERAARYREYLQRFFKLVKFEVVFVPTELFMAQLVMSRQVAAGRQL
jgi:hypothetical protein